MPEDYELLLRLDCNNFKSTLEEGAIDKFPVLVIGEVNGGKGKLSTHDMDSSHCEISLVEPWVVGTEVRRLPCNHAFCKGCIDYWLKEVSHKCPNLSCYWCKESDD